MEPQLDYWRKFKGAFRQELSACAADEVSTAWKKSTNRTTFYEENLLPRVADNLQLKFLKEEFKIDYSLCKQAPDGYLVPLIFVESENIAMVADSELRKLCLLYSPLKVLITCVEWSDEPGYWKKGGCKAKLTKKWSNIIRAHNSILPQLAVTGVIVAEWNTYLRYYSLAFDHRGELIDSEDKFFEKEYS